MKNKFIIATREIRYSVDEIKQSIRDIDNDPTMQVSDDMVWDLIDGWVQEDMRAEFSRHDIRWTDEDGLELN